MRTEAVVSLGFSSEKSLKSFVDALLPELNDRIGSRAEAELDRKGNFLFLKVQAENTIMLRSNLNAYLRWISSIGNVIELLDGSS